MKTRTKTAGYIWFPADFMSDEPVMVMTLEEEGAYRRLLDHSWLSNGLPWRLNIDDEWAQLPPDERRQLSRKAAKRGGISGAMQGQSPELPRYCPSNARTLFAESLMLTAVLKAEDRRVGLRLWGAVKHLFFERDGRCYNARLERVRAEADAFRQRQSEHGKRGGRPKGSGFSSEKGRLFPKKGSGKPPSPSPSKQRDVVAGEKGTLSESRRPTPRSAPAKLPRSRPARHANGGQCPTCHEGFYLAGYETPKGVVLGKLRCACPPQGDGWHTPAARAFQPPHQELQPS
jgi:uncharacterized protein YdaU (DUF1376 family)